jgi:hypothetical protein
LNTLIVDEKKKERINGPPFSRTSSENKFIRYFSEIL